MRNENNHPNDKVAKTAQKELQLRKHILPKFLQLFIPMALFLLIGSLILYVNEKNTLNKIIKSREFSSLRNQEELIKNDFEAIISDLLYLAAQAENHVRLDGEDILVSPKLALEYLEFARYKGIYDQVRLLDQSGMERVRVNYYPGHPEIVPDDKLQSKGRRYYFTDTISINKGEVFVSPFDLNIEKGQIESPLKPMIRFGTPVFNSEGEKIGAIILNYLGSYLIKDIKGISSAVASSNMLLNAEGYWLISPNQGDEWGFMYSDNKDQSMKNRNSTVWKKLQNKRDDQFFHSGDLYTYNTICPLQEEVISSTGSSRAYAPSTGFIDSSNYYWFLISVVPKAMFLEAIKPFMIKMVSVNTFVLLLLGSGCWVIAIARARNELLFNELKDALANIHTLSGLIPICSACKSIRDDKGYWNRIEKYVSAHSDAQFSHSICPNCIETLYPGLLHKEGEEIDES